MKQTRRPALARHANVTAINKCSNNKAAPSADVAAPVKPGQTALVQDPWVIEDLAPHLPEGRLQSTSTI